MIQSPAYAIQMEKNMYWQKCMFTLKDRKGENILSDYPLLQWTVPKVLVS